MPDQSETETEDGVPAKVWQTALDYKARWTVHRGAGSGGQGRGYVVSRTGDGAATPYFLKELKDQSNPQRRARISPSPMKMAAAKRKCCGPLSRTRTSISPTIR